MIEDRFDALRDVGVAADVIAAMRQLVGTGDDGELIHIDPIEFAERYGVPEGDAIDGFLHASRLGMFDLSWDVVCPDCGGILSEVVSLRQVRRPEMGCALCDRSYETDLDHLIAVTFTVSPRVRAIRGHRPEDQAPIDYLREHYLGPTLVLPRGEEFVRMCAAWHRWIDAIPPRSEAVVELDLAPGWMIVQEYRFHCATILEVTGEPATDRRDIAIAFGHGGATPAKLSIAPGPARFVIENLTDHRGLCTVFDANDALHDMMARRKPYLTAKQVVTSQTFRDLYRTEVLDLDQGLRLRNLTVLFTDLRSSTELYDRIGDLAAYDLVRRHFAVLGDVIGDHRGAVVKTIGDAVMATFSTPVAGMAAALDMRDQMARFNVDRGDAALLLKIGLHAGPCLAVWSNERLDFFGQTVNIAARVQALAPAGGIVATESALDGDVRALLVRAGATLRPRQAALRGIRDHMTMFELGPT
jgi:class 3 adenylate cyclase